MTRTTIKKIDHLLAYPLKLGQEPVRLGETVLLIDCPYIEPDCKQNVYTGTITKRAFGDRFSYDIEPSVDIHGFSDGLVIGENGYVVGVVTVCFNNMPFGCL